MHITENYLEPAHSIKDSLLYLVHRNNPEKHQYSIDECFGTLKPQLEKMLDDDTEDIKVFKILDLLDSIECQISYGVFFRLCAEKGLWSDLRRGSYLFTQAIKEHNQRYISSSSFFNDIENYSSLQKNGKL